MTSAIEEFERILGRYLKDHSPSTSLGETHTPEMIALTLNLTVREVTPNLETIGDLQGFSRKFLETKVITLEGAWSWKAFSSALALLVYVIVLFPNADDFLDFQAINVCLAKNLVLALLADVYYYLHTRHDKKGGVVLCCSPLLYNFLMSHMPQKGPFISEDLKWPQKLASLTSNYILWYK